MKILNVRHPVMALLLFTVASLPVLSQDHVADPPELEALRQSWEEAEEKAARPIKESYLDALIKLRDSLTRAGKLDEALLVRTEIEDLSGVSAGKKPGAPERPAQLKSLNEIFRREIAKITRQNDKKYIAALRVLKKEMENENNLEGALAVSRELKRQTLKTKEGIERRETVEADQNRRSPLQTKVQLELGEEYRIVPNPEDKWTGGGSKSGKWCGYQGYGKASNWMRMYARVGDGKELPVDPEALMKAEMAGTLFLFVEDGDVGGNKGEIGVTIRTAAKARELLPGK